MDKEDNNPDDIITWIFKNGIKTEKGEELDFRDRPFLLDILNDWNKNIVVKKCAQIGGSVTFNLKVLYAILNFRFNVIYTFPTDDDVKEFVSSKTNKLIAANPQVFKGLQTDNIERKEINERFLFFKGTISKTAAIMTTADVLIHDEADRSDQKTLDDYRSRVKAKESWKGRWIFSNPTTEKGIVDNAWQNSDQKEWVIACPHCGLKQYLVWPDNIDLVRQTFICSKCKNEISDDVRRQGEWTTQNPGAKISGYHISHLICPWIKASDIIEDSQADQEYFYNFILGEPYNPGDISITRSTILDLWTPDFKKLETGNYFLGVDVGNIKHYVLGSEKGILKVGRFPNWSYFDDLMKFYRPTVVIDALPDTVASRYYVDKYRTVLMSFFQDNKANPQEIVWWGEGDKLGIVYSNRNRILDQLIDRMLKAEFLIGVSSDNEFREYIKHWLTLRRIKVVDTKGIESYKWDSTTGVDHFVLSTLYYYLATLSQSNGAVFGDLEGRKPQLVIEVKGLDGHYEQQLNLKELLEERENL